MNRLSKILVSVGIMLSASPIALMACPPDTCGDCEYWDGYTQQCESECWGCCSCYYYCYDDNWWCEYLWGQGVYCVDCQCHSSCDQGDYNCSDWFTSVTFSLNPALKAKVESAINYIPGVSISLNEVSGAITGKHKDCCQESATLIDDGERYSERSVTLSAEIGSVTIWGVPTISEHYDWGVLAVDLDFEAGVGIDNWDVSITGEAGHRYNDCTGVDCGYGGVSVGTSATLGVRLEVILCVETLWTDKRCVDIEATPLSITAGISGSLGENLNGCQEGLTGSVTVGEIVFRASFSVDGLGAKAYEHTICDGATF